MKNSILVNTIQRFTLDDEDIELQIPNPEIYAVFHFLNELDEGFPNSNLAILTLHQEGTQESSKFFLN